MPFTLILVPYDSAHEGARHGAGPLALADGGLQALLERRGHDVRRVVVHPPADAWRAEIGTAFHLARGVAEAVRDARATGRFPLVVAGNCMTSLGVVAALGAGTRVLWCDAHGDFNTPETTIGGFLDGMALAALTGRCWSELARRIPGFAPVDESHAWLLGARDLDPLEAEALERSAVRRIPAPAVGAETASLVAREVPDAAPLYLHLDVDVLDPRDGRANGYAAPDGVPSASLDAFCAALAAHAPPSAVLLSAYDPAVDTDGRARRAALSAVEALLGAGTPQAAWRTGT